MMPGARADVDDVRIRGRDGDRADRAGALVVEQRMPGRAVIGGAPDAAIVEADVSHVRLAWHAGHGAGATGARRADLAPVHLGVDVGVWAGSCGEKAISATTTVLRTRGPPRAGDNAWSMALTCRLAKCARWRCAVLVVINTGPPCHYGLVEPSSSFWGTHSLLGALCAPTCRQVSSSGQRSLLSPRRARARKIPRKPVPRSRRRPRSVSVGTAVADHALTGAAESFPKGTAKLYCFSKITGADNSEVEHVWYKGDAEQGRVKLKVGGSPWRTFSSKTLGPDASGDWRCDVVQDGKVLQSVKFKVE